MLCAMKVIVLLKLKVDLTMFLQFDNKDQIEMVNN